MNKFPERLKFLRTANRLTQEKLCTDIDDFFGYPISKATISQYENGNREPNITMLINLAQYFDCSIDYLIGVSDHRSIMDSSEFMIKMLLLKNIVDVLPNMDYINSHDLNKLVLDYLKSNGLKKI